VRQLDVTASQLVTLVAFAIVASGCGFAPGNGPYATSVAEGVRPRLPAANAVAISRSNLDAQTPEIAAPEQHVVPHITETWAVSASEASTIDGCIPDEASTDIVWITKGVGDYLNLRDLPWSRATTQANADTPLALACGGPGPSGTIVIDDATGEILGVFPAIPGYPHPTADNVPSPSVGLTGNSPTLSEGEVEAFMLMVKT
jgi:hypothetical protein